MRFFGRMFSTRTVHDRYRHARGIADRAAPPGPQTFADVAMLGRLSEASAARFVTPQTAPSSPAPVVGPSVDADIHELNEKISYKKLLLASLENRTPGQGFDRTPLARHAEASALRAEICADEAKLSELQAARDAYVLAESRHAEERAVKDRWTEMQKTCRELKDQLVATETEVLQLRADREFSQEKFYKAIAAVDSHIANPPRLDDYPTEEELSDYRQLGVELEQERAALSVKYREADDAHQRGVMAALDARQKMESAAVAERQLRPPDADTR